MESEVTFKEVIDYIKENDGKLIKYADHLLGMVSICSPLVLGPAALPVLGLLGAKDQLIKSGNKILSIFTKKKKEDYFERSNRMRMAYCIIHYTAFFEAVERLLPEIQKSFGLKTSEPLFLSKIVEKKFNNKIDKNIESIDNENSSLDSYSINLPHPIDTVNLQNNKVQTLYQELCKGLTMLILESEMWERLEEKSKKIIIYKLNLLPEMSLDCFSAQYFKLAESFPEFYIWSNLKEHDRTKQLITSQSIYLKKLVKISDEKNNDIDIGLKKIEETINSIPAEIETRKTSHIIEGLRKKYKNRINQSIIDEERMNGETIPSLSFPKKHKIFIPQSFRVLQKKNINVNLEEETSWLNTSRKNKLAPFIFRFLSSPFSTQCPLIILGHPGSGKSLLTEILAAKLITPSFKIIRVELRNINPENEIYAQIEEQILKDTHEEISWASLSRQLNDKPILIIFDGFDELLQIHGKMFYDYINKVKKFQKEEAVLCRPVQVIITSRITLIDKVDIPLGTTIIRLESFNQDQRNLWINIWNKTNQNYFLKKKISPFSLPNDERIINIGEQPLLLLMLAIYDSDKNKLREKRGLDQTKLYNSLLRRFIHRQNEKGEPGRVFTSLNSEDQKRKVDIDFQKLGVAALSMHNRGTLCIHKDQLEKDLNFFNLNNKHNMLQGKTFNEAEILLGSFFFVYESVSIRRGEKADKRDKHSAYEFLHNTFGEFLAADFILRMLLEETQALLTLKNNKTLHSYLHQRLDSVDGFPTDWYSCFIYSALHSNPNMLKLMKEWLPHRLSSAKILWADFLSGFDLIIYSHLNMFLTKNFFPTIMMSNNQTPYPDLPVLGYIAHYSLNLIVLRTILGDKDYVFNEELIEKFNDVSRPWERLTYLWRSWFSVENLKGLKSIMSANRKGNTIYIKQNTQFILTTRKINYSLSSEDESKSLVEIANSLGDVNIPHNIRGLMAFAALGISVDVRNIEHLDLKLQQSHKMEAIGNLAGGIAHDFNNILSAIIGYTELSLGDAESMPNLKNKLNEILKAGYRARDLVKQILVFSRQVDHEKQAVPVKMIIKEALKLLWASIPKTIEFRQNLLSDSMVIADPTQIHQILMNLCTNAEHAMNESGGILEVTLSDVEINKNFSMRNTEITSGRYVCLTVRDTGHGIAEEHINRIYDPFFTTKDPDKGTGLGLSVVHGIVKSHGGEITVESELGKGSSFHVFLPVFEKQIEPEIEISFQIPKGNERILFVDDERSIMELGLQVLEQLGYQVQAHTSSLAALELFKDSPNNFDLIITNFAMPHMNGTKLAHELMNIRQDIPIILCTGFSEKINEAQALEIGFRAFIMKPISIEHIAKKIRQVLDETRSESDIE